MPAVRGIIERRMLINFRCAPEVLARLLPAPFRPKLVRGWGMVGVCLIRLGKIRPTFLPALAGLSSENAAHRFAIEWDDRETTRAGVFIPRRDTNSLLNRLAGGRVFPGVHHAASFRVWETGQRFKLEMRSRDETAFVRVLARVTGSLPERSVFSSLEDATSFFRDGAIGWSPGMAPGQFDGLELCCNAWRMEALAVERIESSFFQDRRAFPSGSIEFDCALLMRDVPHAWHALGTIHNGESTEGKV
jgi:hypothetical protein